MVVDYVLPEWFPRVFTGANGYSHTFRREFDALLGRELAEAYSRRPAVFQAIRDGVKDKTPYGYNPEVERVLMPLAEHEGKTPAELLFGLEAGYESLARSGGVADLAGMLLMKSEPVEHVREFFSYCAEDRSVTQNQVEWEDVWAWGTRGDKKDPFAAWVYHVSGSDYTALAIRSGYRGARLKSLARYQKNIFEMAVIGVPVPYAVDVLTGLTTKTGDDFIGFRSNDFVMKCWEQGLAVEYAVQVYED